MSMIGAMYGRRTPVASATISEVECVWDGTAWVAATASAVPAALRVQLFNALPALVAITAPAGLKQDGTAGNGVQVGSLEMSPQTSAEQIIQGIANADTRAFAAWLCQEPIGDNRIPAGKWASSLYAGVDSVAAGSVTTITRAVYKVRKNVFGGASVEGDGANTRRVRITSGAFAGGSFKTSATNTLASFLQLPGGIYQITSIEDANTAWITVPTGYVNVQSAQFSVWDRLFSAATTAITSISTSYAVKTAETVQGEFPCQVEDMIGLLDFVTSTHSRTVTVAYNGTTNNTRTDTAFSVSHDMLSGIQGGAVGERYHLDAADYAAARAIGTMYSGNDAPGTGSNTLTIGHSRIWNHVAEGKTYLMTRTAESVYRRVELTD